MSHWKEEIQLQDGRRLTIDRGKTYGGPVEMGQRQNPVAKWTMKFTPPKGEKSIELEVPGGVLLMLLDFDNEVPFVAASLRRGNAFFQYGCPNPPFLFLKYTDGWKEIPPQDFPVKFAKANLPADSEEYMRLADAGGAISSVQIQAINESNTLEVGVTKIWMHPIAGSTGICPRTAPITR